MPLPLRHSVNSAAVLRTPKQINVSGSHHKAEQQFYVFRNACTFTKRASSFDLLWDVGLHQGVAELPGLLTGGITPTRC